MGSFHWLSNWFFHHVHTHNLIYNTCWEDPRIDREALQLTPEDNVLVITSAGCNALDYVLEEPHHVYAVDMNPRQNAVLELKISGIRNLGYEEFFQLFGFGRIKNPETIYKQRLRKDLSSEAQKFWDKHMYYFCSEYPRNSYYFHGTTGIIARLINKHIDWKPGLRASVMRMFDAENLDEQRDIYYSQVKDVAWTPLIRKLICTDLTLCLAGVPKAQRIQVERNFSGGVAGIIEQCIDTVFAHLPLWDNYFWRVYVMGCYSWQCCPEYLKEEGFKRLKAGLVDRITVSTNTVEGFLRKHQGEISKFVLLDHMDWLADHRQDLLQQEWQAIVDRSNAHARILFRSGGLYVDYVDPIMVQVRSACYRLGELLQYDHHRAQLLHARDRVHMYGSFYIADLTIA